MPKCQFLFSGVFGSRKSLLQIFSELHETKGQVPIFPTRTRSPKERRRGATRWPNHLAARQWAQPRLPVVWAPRGSADIVPSPIYSPRRENPKTPSLSSRTYSLPPPSSTLTRGVLKLFLAPCRRGESSPEGSTSPCLPPE